jgi:hypothetical protein
MRAENKADYQNMENNEVVSEYFVKNSGDDETISMPFQYRLILFQEKFH